MAILRASTVPLSSAPILSQASSERHLEERPVEASLLIGNLDVVEFELGRRQEHEVNLAADLHLAAEQVGGLRLEDGAIVVPVNEKRRGKKRAQDQNQHCRQREQERIHRRLTQG